MDDDEYRLRAKYGYTASLVYIILMVHKRFTLSCEIAIPSIPPHIEGIRGFIFLNSTYDLSPWLTPFSKKTLTDAVAWVLIAINQWWHNDTNLYGLKVCKDPFSIIFLQFQHMVLGLTSKRGLKEALYEEGKKRRKGQQPHFLLFTIKIYLYPPRLKYVWVSCPKVFTVELLTFAC